MKVPKSANKLLKNESLHRAFRRMIGVDDINPDIITSKFDNMKDHMAKFIIYLQNIYAAGIMIDIHDYIEAAEATMNGLYIEPNDLKIVSDLREINMITDETEKRNRLAELFTNVRYDPERLRHSYNNLISSTLFKDMCEFINKCTTYLKTYKKESGNELHDLEDSNNLRSDFLVNINRAILFKFSNVDFRSFFIVDQDEDTKAYILQWLYRVYHICKLLLDEHCKPNIEAKEYIEVILESIKVARKQISRCHDAFNMMEKMIHKFEERFPTYYKYFIITDNPYIILERYIKDVSEEAKNTNAKTRGQFKRILVHFSKKLNEVPSNDTDIRNVIDLASALDIEAEEME